MRLYEPHVTTLSTARQGRVELRGGHLVGVIPLGVRTLEFDTADELVELLASGRDLLQQLTEAHRRSEAGQRPIPVHGQPARPYSPMTDGTTLMRTPPPAPQGTHASPPPPVAPEPERWVVPDPPHAASAS